MLLSADKTKHRSLQDNDKCWSIPSLAAANGAACLCHPSTQLRAALLQKTARDLVRAWESRAAGNPAFQQTGKPWPRHLWSEKVLGHALKDKNQSLIWPSHAGIAAQSCLFKQRQPTLIAPPCLSLNTNSSLDLLEAVPCVSRWVQKDKDPSLFPISSLSVPSYPLEGYQRATVSLKIK